MRQERNLRHQIKLSESYAWEEKTRDGKQIRHYFPYAMEEMHEPQRIIWPPAASLNSRYTNVSMNESASDANKLRKNLFIPNTMMNFLTGQEKKIPLANKTDKLTAYEDEDAGPLGLSKLFFSSLPEVSSPGERREREAWEMVSFPLHFLFFSG